MSLDLNEVEEHIRIDGREIPYYREYAGKNVEKAVYIKLAGREIMPLHRLIERKVNSGNGGWNKYFGSGDGVVYPARGTSRKRVFKVTLNSSRIRDMTLNSQLLNGNLIVPSYEEIEGKEFDRKDLNLERDLSLEEVSEHPLWLEFFRGDKKLLEKCAERVFRKGKDNGGYEKMMGVYLATEIVKAHEKAWYLDWTGDFERFCANGWYNLVSREGRFVGMVPKTLSAN